MKKTNMFKFICLVCCAFIFVSAMPYTGMAGINEQSDSGCYIKSARSDTRFRPCASESLSHGKIPGKEFLIKSDESQVYTDRSKELTSISGVNFIIPDANYTLLRTVFDNHLSYCKREVYHLLI